MSFWDTSALVPLLIQQERTAEAEAIYKKELQGVFVWWGTYSECISAVARLERNGHLGVDEAEQALEVLALLAKSWNEILPTDSVRDKSNRLLRLHPLRTGDAFQLASALVASEDHASKIAFVSFDERLAVAARKEGFKVIG